MNKWIATFLILTLSGSLSACKTLNIDSPMNLDSNKSDTTVSPVEAVEAINTRDSNWIEDIETVQESIKLYQIDYKEYYTEAELDRILDSLVADVPKLSDDEIVLKLKKLISSLNDSHTVMGLPEHMTNRVMPIKMAYVDGELYCVNATGAYKDLLFKKIVKIGDFDSNYVINKLTEYASSENEYGRRYHALSGLRTGGILKALGITGDDDFAELTYEIDSHGKTENMEVYYIDYTDHFDAEYVYDAPINNNVSSIDIWYKDSFWYEYDEENKLLVFTTSRWIEENKGDFRAFCSELWDFVDNHDVETFVMDVRYNSGGFTEFVHMFRKGAIERKELINPDSFYVFTGNYTNSCGVISAADMKRNNLATIIGEPTKGSPNTRHSGPHFKLKHSGIDLLFSSGITMGYPGYDYETLIPDVIIERDLEDYENQRDPLIEYVINANKSL